MLNTVLVQHDRPYTALIETTRSETVRLLDLLKAYICYNAFYAPPATLDYIDSDIAKSHWRSRYLP